MNNREWMEIHINTLFQCDPHGRLRCINEPGPEGAPPPAPRFYMGRTSEGNSWRFRYDLPAATVAQLERLCQSEPVTANFQALPQNYAAIKTIFASQSPVESEYRGPAYWIPETVTASPAAVLLEEATIAVAQPHFPWLTSADPYYAMGPVAAVMVNGRAVSLCFCSRTPGLATEAGLETVAGYRGKGYAGAAVATWAAAVRQRGCRPLYSTSWDNLASQRVATKLGLICYGEDWSLG